MNEDNFSEIFKQLIHGTGKVVFTFDVEMNAVCFVSDGFEQMWGLPKGRVISAPLTILDTIHPDDKEFLIKEYGNILTGKAIDELEFRIILSDGTTKCLLLAVQLMKDKQGKSYLAGMVDDISTIKDNISTLQKFAAKKNSILEVLSHDLAGPLANIQSLADLLNCRLEGYKDDELNKIVNIIYESSARSIRLIRDFVDYEFLESTNPGLLKVRMNLVEKVQEIVDEFVEAEDYINKKFSFTASSDHIFVYIDQGKFMQVINNIISNAIKFTHDGGIISIDLQEHADTVMVSIKDNGIGIPEEYQNELFDKFTRARRKGLKGEPSIGLGMSIIKTIVEWHGGRIWFESEENVGTAFYIEIPKK